MKKFLIILPFVLVLLLIIGFSKWQTYRNVSDFFSMNFHAKIIKIESSRGTRAYLDNDYSFDLSRYVGPALREDDYLIKERGTISVLRIINEEKVHIGDGKAIKPEESFIQYVF